MPPVEAATPQEHAESGAPLELAPAADDPVSTALVEVTQTNTLITQHLSAVRALAARYKDVVYDVKTTAGYEAAAKIRKELREQGRYPIQTLQKAGSKMLGTMQRQFNARCDEITAECEGVHEKPWHDVLTAEDQRKAKEKADREAADARRKEEHQLTIAVITTMATSMVGASGDDIARQLENVKQIIVDESYEEFEGQALQAKDEALRQLQGMLVTARADEAERAEMEETRRQQAAFAAEQQRLRQEADAQAAADRARAEAAEAEMAAMRAQLKAAADREEAQRLENERARQERADAIQKRIVAIKIAGSPLEGRSSEQLASISETLLRLTLTEDLLGDRVNEAIAARNAREAEVTAAHDAAVAREAAEAETERQRVEEEARQKRAAEVEQRIAELRANGPRVDETAAELSARLQIVDTGFMPGVDDFDDRVQEAAAVHGQVVADIKAAVTERAERERIEAEQAELRRQQQAEQMAAMALADAKRSHGEELYEALRAIVIEAGDDLEGKHHIRCAVELLLQINPAETFED